MSGRGHRRFGIAASLAILLLSAACGRRLEAPPLEILQRDSLIGAGKILQVKSMTNEELRGLEVTIKAESGEMVYTEARLGAYETLEIGWKKLGGWQIPDEAEVEVRAEGYLLAHRARLSESESEATADRQ